jgi:glycosyltransferase involved in cell wall biosynthesis
MRVLHLCRRYRDVGGMERYLYDLCQILLREGHALCVVHDESTPEDFRIPGVRAVCVPGVATYHPASNEAAWRGLAEVAEEFRPDVVHLHDPANPYTTRRVQDAWPTLIFVQTCGYYCLGTKFFPRAAGVGSVCERAFGPTCLPLAVGCGCATRRPAALARGYARVRRELECLHAGHALMVASRYMKSVLCVNGIEPARVKVVPLFTAPVASAPPVPAEPRLLFVGRLETGKGIELLLETIALLPEASLDVVGDGGLAAAAQALAQRRGLGSRVRFLGWRAGTELDAQYAAARAVVVPSVWPEPFGLVGIEAMARGRPVVGVDRGGIPEWLEHGETGFLADATPEALAAALRPVLEDLALARRLGDRARERCRERFSPEAHCRELCRTYEWAVSGAKRCLQNVRSRAENETAASERARRLELRTGERKTREGAE